MTLDESIENLKEDYEIDMYIRDIAPQLAEWLEELKELRELKDTITSNAEVLERQGYNEAIDDFAKRLTTYLGVENATKYGNKNAEQQRMSYDTLMKYEIADAIEDVAEQLKAGD